MTLFESGEMYLETILLLSKKSELVRSVDVCEYMGFSKPSVSRAVNKLKAEELISVEDNGALKLTSKGYAIASKIFDRHNVISEFLISIGVNRDTAVSDACKMEHDISDETYEAIKKLLNK